MKEAHLKLENVNLLTRHVLPKRHVRSRINDLNKSPFS